MIHKVKWKRNIIIIMVPSLQMREIKFGSNSRWWSERPVPQFTASLYQASPQTQSPHRSVPAQTPSWDLPDSVDWCWCL